MNKNIEYEKFAQEIYQGLLIEDGLTTEIKHDIKLQGSSSRHQIDVYWEYTFAGVKHRVAIECKNYTSKISIGKIRDFHSVLTDIGNINGIMVSTNGFQKGAKEFAEHYGINLKILRKPKREDWKGRIKSVSTNIEIISPFAKNYFVQLDLDWCKKNLSEEAISSIDVKLSGLNTETWIYDRHYKPFKNFFQLQDEAPINKDKLIDNEHFYTYDDAYVKCENSGFIKIVGVWIKYDTSIEKTRLTLDSETITKAIIQDVLTGEMKFINHKYT